ncbi:type I toxin-antitoxin system Fst family toxin [Mammaliicoccus sciuri]
MLSWIIAPIICGCAVAYFSHWLENEEKIKGDIYDTINKTPSLRP